MKKLLFVIISMSMTGCNFQDTFAPRPEVNFSYEESPGGWVVLKAEGERLGEIEWNIEGVARTFNGPDIRQKFSRNGIYLVECTATYKNRTAQKSKGIKITMAN